MSQNTNLTDQVVQRVVDRAGTLAKSIAQSIGTPVDSSKLSRAQQTQLWNLPNPQADPAMVGSLIAQGQHSQALDQMYPWRNRMIGQGPPAVRVNRAQMFADMAAKNVSS